MKRPTAWCDRCKATVYADDVHSCYDADAVERVRQCEREVVDAAKRWERLYKWQRDSGMIVAEHELAEAVRALTAAEGA